MNESSILESVPKEEELGPSAEVIELPAGEPVKNDESERYTARQKEIIQKAMAKEPYKKFGTREYTKEEWEVRQAEIIRNAMAKGEQKKPEADAPVPEKAREIRSQLEVAMDRARQIEERDKAEQAEKLRSEAQEAAAPKPRPERGSKEELIAQNELLETFYIPIPKGEEVLVAGEEGIWTVAEYFPATKQYDVVKGGLTLKMPAEKVTQPSENAGNKKSWYSKISGKMKKWFKKTGRNNTVLPRS